jgi:hypothetical protein
MSLENMKSMQGQIQRNISKIKVEKNIPAIQPARAMNANTNLGTGMSAGQHAVVGGASSFTISGGTMGGAGSVGGSRGLGNASGGGGGGGGDGDGDGGGKQGGHSGA